MIARRLRPHLLFLPPLIFLFQAGDEKNKLVAKAKKLSAELKEAKATLASEKQ